MDSSGEAAADNIDYRRLFEANPDAMWLLTLDGHVYYGNRRARAFMVVDDNPEWKSLWPTDSQVGAARALKLAVDGQIGRFHSFLYMDGAAPIYLHTEMMPVLDGGGRPDRVLAIARDVTEQVEATAFLESVFNLLPLSLTVKNARNGRYVLFNRSAEDLMDRTADEVIGKTAEEALPEHVAGMISVSDARALASLAWRQASDDKVETENGARYFSTRRALTFDDAGPRHLIAITEDVTEARAGADALRAAVGAAEAASQAKSAFLANMSHELRTPLNGIVAAAEMLSQHELPPRQQAMLNLIRSSGETLNRLLSDVLDVARIEAGAVKLEIAPFHLGELVRELTDMFRLEMEERGLALNLDIAPEADRCFRGDRLRIRQILVNLISNAVKFTEHGAITVSLALAAEDRVRLTVTDTGIGFDPAQKAQIFVRFHQMDTSHTRRYGGAGLGLSICRELCDLMGATLDCDAQPGRGASFWLEASLEPAAVEAPQGNVPASQPEDLQILVAEDHPGNRRVLELMLESAAGVRMVENGALALDAFRDCVFGLVLMDMQMPEMDGLAATQAIRAFEKSVGRPPTPIIMLTANTQPEHVAASLAAGADLHLAKPISPHALFGAIEQLLSSYTERAVA
ncbi:MAG: ATP-binding protein [Caulobacteraceae bacterium]|nr:ATP-binding protein [Caulobacteraceae bacterium]